MSQKLKLEIDGLRVESFDTQDEARRRGTVMGYITLYCEDTEDPDWCGSGATMETCDGSSCFPTCAGNTCEWQTCGMCNPNHTRYVTCDGPTCPYNTNCGG